MIDTFVAMACPAWNPWAALRERPRTTLLWQALAGRAGLAEVAPDGSEIVVLDPRLGRRDRRAVLAHELIHLERRLLPQGTPQAVLAREEHQVRAEVVRRLVPPPDLRGLVAALASVEPVTAALVADEFDVPTAVAEAALEALRSGRC